jgi:arginine decarboxylase-like protein
VIVCNGYKDREYIRLALIGEKLGHKVYLDQRFNHALMLVNFDRVNQEVVALIAVRFTRAFKPGSGSAGSAR